MITPDRMASVDANAAALGIPRTQLMESSGNAVARTVRNHVDPGDRVILCCGRGNNGGDGFVAARFLSEYDTHTALVGHPDRITTEIATENWEALKAAELPRTVVDDTTAVAELPLESADCIVDAMVGTGVTGALREPAATTARAINECDTPVVAVDVPSGVDADTGEAAGEAVEADHVVTFHDMKPGLASLAARVTVADIGIPTAAERFVGPGDCPPRDRQSTSHKGDHGEVLVLGGGPYTGAPALTGQAALRAGADLVHIAAPESVASEIQGYNENLIVHPLAGKRFTPAVVDSVVDRADSVDSVVCGPGLGDHPETQTAVADFFEAFSGQGVVDADALSVVAETETDASLVCTPHQGELQAMGGTTAEKWEERATLVEAFASEVGQTLLVKGAYDVVTDGERTRINRTGTPGMTVGGTGDVLAGVVGCLLAGSEPIAAAAAGAYLTGRAGEFADDDHGNCLVATDVIERLPEAFET